MGEGVAVSVWLFGLSRMGIAKKVFCSLRSPLPQSVDYG